MAVVDQVVIADPGGTQVDVTAANAIKTDSSHVTQPVSVGSLPLPAGSATEATLTAIKTAVELIDDTVNGGELQVDIVSPIPTGTNNIGKIIVTDGSDDASVLNLLNSNPIVVAIADANGDQIVTFGGGSQYTEDDAAPANPIGNSIALVRADSPSATTTTDGDIVAQRGSDYGAAYVTLLDTAGNAVAVAGGTQYAEGATAATITGQAIMWEDAADTLRSVSAVKPLPVNIIAGASSGTEYVEGVTDATIAGGAMMMESAGDTLVPAQGTIVDGLLVNLGSNNDVTVTGSVTANAGTDLNTSALALEATLQSIRTAVELIDNTVAGTELQVDVLTLPLITAIDLDIRDLTSADVVTAELSAVDNAVLDAIAASVAAIDVDASTIIGHVDGLEALIGTTNTNTGNSATALQLIDDTVVVLGTATYAEASSKGLVVGAVRTDADVPLVNTTNEFTPLQVDANGRLKVEVFSGEALPVTMTSTTVTGTVSVTQSGTWVLGANSGVDIGDVTINNAAGAAAVNIQDGGNSITVDGAVTVTGVATEATLASLLTSSQLIDDTIFVLGTDTYSEAVSKGQLIGAVRRDSDTTLTSVTNEIGPLQMDANGRLKVEVFDGGDSHTVDAPVGTPVNVQIGNATLVAGVIDETGSGAVDALAVGGGTAHDAVDSGNPIKVGFKAITALPAAVAASDRANGISDLWGRQLISHIDPAQQITKAVNVTTTQTGTDVWDPAASSKIAITSVVIASYGTTAARVILWFGDNADTTYTAGTDQVLIAASFAPSTTAKPGLVFTPAFPIFCTTADRELHLTTDAGISLDITIHGYEFL